MRDDGNSRREHDGHATTSQRSLGIELERDSSYEMTVVEITDTKMAMVFFVTLDLHIDMSIKQEPNLPRTPEWFKSEYARTNSMGRLGYPMAAGLGQCFPLSLSPRCLVGSS